jgi:hypothetical protein
MHTYIHTYCTYVCVYVYVSMHTEVYQVMENCTQLGQWATHSWISEPHTAGLVSHTQLGQWATHSWVSKPHTAGSVHSWVSEPHTAGSVATHSWVSEPHTAGLVSHTQLGQWATHTQLGQCGWVRLWRLLECTVDNVPVQWIDYKQWQTILCKTLGNEEFPLFCVQQLWRWLRSGSCLTVWRNLPAKFCLG